MDHYWQQDRESGLDQQQWDKTVRPQVSAENDEERISCITRRDVRRQYRAMNDRIGVLHELNCAAGNPGPRGKQKKRRRQRAKIANLARSTRAEPLGANRAIAARAMSRSATAAPRCGAVAVSDINGSDCDDDIETFVRCELAAVSTARTETARVRGPAI